MLSDEFASWLMVHGGETKSIEWRECEYGLGGFATSPLPAGTVYSSLPVSAVLRESYIMSLPEMQSISYEFSQSVSSPPLTPEEISAFVFSAFVMMELRNKSETSWGPYIRSLPTTYNDPLWWSESDLLLLRGTNLGNAIEGERSKVQNAFNLVRRSSAVASMEKREKIKFTFGDFLRARSSFLSRRFPERLCSPEVKNQKASAMLPLLDCFNHQYATPVTWLYDPDTSKIGFRLEAAVPRGAQVFNNYGAKSNEEFLTAFGFCMLNNPQDEVAIAVATSYGGQALATVRAEMLQALGIGIKFYLKR